MADSVVETQYGRVRGVEENGVSVWRGIPFARAPLGAYRFKPPQPPDPWTDVQDAREFGPGCLQIDARPILAFASVPPSRQSEDCLTLNIWAPALDGKPRPVLVWIYGGSFVMGGGSLPVYDGRALALDGNMVVVTFNYRLGPFGFLYLDDLGNPSFQGSGNVGLLDQVAALEWVRDNIAQFGGDPTRVTVAGESAGAISVSNLLTMPRARNLFHQAILQSGAGLMGSLPPAARIPARATLLQRLGIPGNDVHRLQSIPAKDVFEASKGLPWVPVLDGAALDMPMWTALENGRAAGVRVLTGFNRHEYRYFMEPAWQALDDEAMRRQYEATLAGPAPPQAASHYLSGKSGVGLYDALAQLGTDKLFLAPTYRFAALQSRHAPVWVYRFDWESTACEGLLKARHAMEIPFVFNTLEAPGIASFTGTSADRGEVARQMHHAWIAFIAAGTPETPAVPPWPSYSADRRAVLAINRTSRILHDPDADALHLWDEIYG